MTNALVLCKIKFQKAYMNTSRVVCFATYSFEQQGDGYLCKLSQNQLDTRTVPILHTLHHSLQENIDNEVLVDVQSKATCMVMVEN